MFEKLFAFFRKPSNPTTDLGTVESNVMDILCTYPDTRNSDTLLYAYYIKEYYGIKTFFEYANSKIAVPSMESISRTRRKIQARGMFVPTDAEVIRKRRKAVDDYIQYSRT